MLFRSSYAILRIVSLLCENSTRHPSFGNNDILARSHRTQMCHCSSRCMRYSIWFFEASIHEDGQRPKGYSGRGRRFRLSSERRNGAGLELKVPRKSTKSTNVRGQSRNFLRASARFQARVLAAPRRHWPTSTISGTRLAGSTSGRKPTRRRATPRASATTR